MTEGLSRKIIESFTDDDLALLRERLRLEEQEGYMSASEAAKYLSSTPSAVYQKVRSGKLRVYRQGRSVRFKRADLDAAFRPDR